MRFREFEGRDELELLSREFLFAMEEVPVHTFIKLFPVFNWQRVRDWLSCHLSQNVSGDIQPKDRGKGT
jgi:hypothetical protein